MPYLKIYNNRNFISCIRVYLLINTTNYTTRKMNKNDLARLYQESKRQEELCEDLDGQLEIMNIKVELQRHVAGSNRERSFTSKSNKCTKFYLNNSGIQYQTRYFTSADYHSVCDPKTFKPQISYWSGTAVTYCKEYIVIEPTEWKS